jgi:hypothetical protein
MQVSECTGVCWYISIPECTDMPEYTGIHECTHVPGYTVYLSGQMCLSAQV